ncbi:MAG: SpoIID/LytB domain-containing protein [Proteobacteria bacterium]|nr:SpoIID/LytB domain-containing protein [Pseudomonadota bacterium]
MRRGASRSRRLAARGLLAGVLVLAATAALPAVADVREPRVRVLLYEGPGPVPVEVAGRRVVLQAAAGGIRAGRESAVAVWRSEAGRLRVDDVRVRGALEARPVPGGLALVNEVPLESYVAGIVGREMSASWAPEALRAQAVVSRTYALYEQGRRRGQPYDVRADTGSQVYGGVDAESAPFLAAVSGTRAEILTFEGQPILAAFHSASGGITASAEEVWGRRVAYLVSVPVPGEDASPDTYWRAAISGTTLGRLLDGLGGPGQPVGAVGSVSVVERSPSGRVLRLRVQGEQRSVTVSGRELRSAMGEDVIRNTAFDVRPGPGGLAFFGSGRGHGVGMSQWGARAMADGGAGYREILSRFYPGTRLEKWTAARHRGALARRGSR